MGRRAVPVLAALVAALLSSGLTAVWLRTHEPKTVAAQPPLVVTLEQRDIAALLVDPGPPYVPVSAGAPVKPVEGLVALGFTRGWSRTWNAPTAERIDAVVLEFAAPEGALDYARGAGHAARLLVRPKPFTVSGVPGSTGLADTVRDRDGHYAQVVVLHRGDRAVLLVFAAASPEPSGAVATLAQREYDALGT